MTVQIFYRFKLVHVPNVGLLVRRETFTIEGESLDVKYLIPSPEQLAEPMQPATYVTAVSTA